MLLRDPIITNPAVSGFLVSPANWVALALSAALMVPVFAGSWHRWLFEIDVDAFVEEQYAVQILNSERRNCAGQMHFLSCFAHAF